MMKKYVIIILVKKKGGINIMKKINMKKSKLENIMNRKMDKII
jgi:hypothetical protein